MGSLNLRDTGVESCKMLSVHSRCAEDSTSVPFVLSVKTIQSNRTRKFAKEFICKDSGRNPTKFLPSSWFQKCLFLRI